MLVDTSLNTTISIVSDSSYVQTLKSDDRKLAWMSGRNGLNIYNHSLESHSGCF